MQVLRQLVSPASVKAEACLTFDEPITVQELEAESDGRRLLPALLERARNLLNEHRETWKTAY